MAQQQFFRWQVVAVPVRRGEPGEVIRPIELSPPEVAPPDGFETSEAWEFVSLQEGFGVNLAVWRRGLERLRSLKVVPSPAKDEQPDASWLTHLEEMRFGHAYEGEPPSAEAVLDLLVYLHGRGVLLASTPIGGGKVTDERNVSPRWRVVTMAPIVGAK